MLSVGIVGLPNVGKSTLFNALLKKQQALAANYPFATIEPNVGVIPVPDERLEKLADLVAAGEGERGVDPSTSLRTNRPPIVPAVVRFVDIAGLVKGASQGEGLGNQFLSHIREVDAIVEVVRNFADEEIIRAGSTEPLSDIEIVNTELILSDIQTANKRIEGLERQNKSPDFEKIIKPKIEALRKALVGFDRGILASFQGFTDEEKELLKDSNLLTLKPFIYVFNSDEAKVAEQSSLNVAPGLTRNPGDGSQVKSGMTINDHPIIFISAKLEAELSSLSMDEQKEYLKELGITESGLDKVVRSAFNELNLITYFTAGPKEVRAWTINKGDKAPCAAGKIHTDFERGFIAAEVISTQELLSVGSYKKAKELGKIRLEGKNYEVKDGDVIEFRFSV